MRDDPIVIPVGFSTVSVCFPFFICHVVLSKEQINNWRNLSPARDVSVHQKRVMQIRV